MKYIVWLISSYFVFNVNHAEDQFRCTSAKDDAVTCVKSVNEVPSGTPVTLPEKIVNEKTLQSLTIDTSGLGRGLTITGADVFKRFANLKVLEFKAEKSLEVDEKLRDTLKTTVFNLPTLREFHWYNTLSEVVGESTILMLPETVEKVVFKKANPQCDLSRCKNLKSLNISDSSIKKLPKLYDPDPCLNELVLQNNPITEFTFMDLARFCRLENVYINEISIPACECNKIDRWKDVMKDEGVKADIRSTCIGKDKENCSNATIENGLKLRKACVMRCDNFWLKYLWHFVIGGCIVGSLMLCCISGWIWHFIVRNKDDI